MIHQFGLLSSRRIDCSEACWRRSHSIAWCYQLLLSSRRRLLILVFHHWFRILPILLLAYRQKGSILFWNLPEVIELNRLQRQPWGSRGLWPRPLNSKRWLLEPYSLRGYFYNWIVATVYVNGGIIRHFNCSIGLNIGFLSSLSLHFNRHRFLLFKGFICMPGFLLWTIFVMELLQFLYDITITHCVQLELLVVFISALLAEFPEALTRLFIFGIFTYFIVFFFTFFNSHIVIFGLEYRHTGPMGQLGKRLNCFTIRRSETTKLVIRLLPWKDYTSSHVLDCFCWEFHTWWLRRFGRTQTS